MERAADSVQTLKRGDGVGADAEGLDFIIILLVFLLNTIVLKKH